MTDEEVACFLQANPAFFQRYPGLFTQLLLPDPHQGNAVSLTERQAMLLRERVKALEARLAELLRIGRDNDALASSLVQWTKALLAEPDRSRIAQIAVEELKRIFAVPLAEIRMWSSPPTAAEEQAARFSCGLRAPLCGADIDVAPIGALVGAWAEARSVALIPLRYTAQADAFGLIALGSSDPARFDATMGTTLLARIGELASAALLPIANAERELPAAIR